MALCGHVMTIVLCAALFSFDSDTQKGGLMNTNELSASINLVDMFFSACDLTLLAFPWQPMFSTLTLMATIRFKDNKLRDECIGLWHELLQHHVCVTVPSEFPPLSV